MLKHVRLIPRHNHHNSRLQTGADTLSMSLSPETPSSSSPAEHLAAQPHLTIQKDPLSWAGNAGIPANGTSARSTSHYVMLL
jgi:hypothetical protein